MAVGLLSLPEDLIARALYFVPLALLPHALAAVRASCAGGAAALKNADVWRALLPLVGGTHKPHARRVSERLALDGESAFVRAWSRLVMRSEALHHSIAVSGQDTKNLTVGMLKLFLSRWSPCPLVDRASPVYNATILMEICKARGIREATLVQCAKHMLSTMHADVNARPSSAHACTPLIIASCRGLPKLVELFLAHGADVHVRGEGRFRVGSTSKTIFGTHTAREWTETLLAAEQANEVLAKDREPLERVRKLLLVHEKLL